MIARTIISSIRVKPFWAVRIMGGFGCAIDMKGAASALLRAFDARTVPKPGTRNRPSHFPRFASFARRPRGTNGRWQPTGGLRPRPPVAATRACDQATPVTQRVRVTQRVSRIRQHPRDAAPALSHRRRPPGASSMHRGPRCDRRAVAGAADHALTVSGSWPARTSSTRSARCRPTGTAYPRSRRRSGPGPSASRPSCSGSGRAPRRQPPSCRSP